MGALHCTLGVMSLDQEKLDKAIDLLKLLDIERLLAGAVPRISDSILDIEPSSVDKQSSTMERKVSPPVKSEQQASSRPLKINLKGLASMHAPQNTSILYIDPSDPTERLYPFCLSLQKLFKDESILLPDDRQLKLHATLVNTIYAKGGKRMPANRNERKNVVETQSSSSAQGEDPASLQNNDRSQGHGPNANALLKFDARPLLEKFKEFVWAEDVVLDRIAICEMGANKQTDANGAVVSEEYTEVASIALPV